MDIWRALKTAASPEAILGKTTWPVFSLSSFAITKQLAEFGAQPKTVLDVGANIGQFAIASIKRFPNCSIYSFEPVKDSYEKLVKNTAAFSNIKCVQLALGDTDASTEINVNSHRHSSSLLELGTAHAEAFPWAKQLGREEIRISTLDSCAATLEFQTPVLLKLDVQGYEMQVLRGGLNTLPRIDFVLLEASFLPLYDGESSLLDLAKLLAEHGFQLVGPLDWLCHPRSGRMLQMDVLFRREQ
jgi:FkbM family methyltransferase